MERLPPTQASQPQTTPTMQQLPPPLGLLNNPHNSWPPGSPLSLVFGTTAVWRSTPIQFTTMIPVDSNGQPIVPPQEQSLTAAFEAANARNDPLHQNEDEDEILVTPSSSGRANLPVAVPERGLSASPVPSQRPMPTRAHPRAATIPGMTPGRTRCDTCWEAHCRCDHDSDGLTDDDLAARPHKKEPRARKNGRARQFKGRKRGGVRKGGAKT